MKSIFSKCYDDWGNLKDNALNIAFNLGKKEGLRIGRKQGRTDAIAEISREMRVLYGNEYEKQIRTDVLNEVSAKMEEIISDKCAEYGVGCIEAYCDACGEFEDWIKEQLKE